MSGLLDRLAETRNVRRLIVLLLALVVVAVVAGAYAVVEASRSATQARLAIARVEDGRVVGQRTTCGALNALIDAGRTVIQAQRVDQGNLDAILRRFNLPVEKTKRAIAAAVARSLVSDEFAKVVRSYGLPPAKVREAIQAALAEGYARQITDNIVKAGGASSVVRKDGLLDCGQLRKESKIGG